MKEKTKAFVTGGAIGVLTRNPENKNKPTSGFAIASLVLGIFALLLGWIPFFGWLFIVLTLVFSIIALVKINKGIVSGRKLAVAGFILGAIGLILAIIVMAAVIRLAFKGAVCADRGCFISRAEQCTSVTYVEESDVGKIRYSVIGSNSTCIFAKEILELSSKEDASVKKALENTKMECVYTEGNFDGRWLTSMVAGLEGCDGELKEKIGSLLLII
jgi:hypothetical protein